MNIKEWVKNNKLLSALIIAVIIYILIVSGTRKSPIAKESETPAETLAEVPTETDVVSTEPVNQTQEEIPSPGSKVEEKSTG